MSKMACGAYIYVQKTMQTIACACVVHLAGVHFFASGGVQD